MAAVAQALFSKLKTWILPCQEKSGVRLAVGKLQGEMQKLLRVGGYVGSSILDQIRSIKTLHVERARYFAPVRFQHRSVPVASQRVCRYVRHFAVFVLL